ncbi:MAG: hypothetical protein ACJAUP_001918 [Cellvibrionaceae bacterium]|jgi:hypothetical protein
MNIGKNSDFSVEATLPLTIIIHFLWARRRRVENRSLYLVNNRFVVHFRCTELIVKDVRQSDFYVPLGYPRTKIDAAPLTGKSAFLYE